MLCEVREAGAVQTSARRRGSGYIKQRAGKENESRTKEEAGQAKEKEIGQRYLGSAN